MSVTQKQIAAHLGISQSQVAHALRGYARISEKTRRQVEEAARELGYNPQSNNAARLLRARRGGSRPRTRTVAVLTGDYFEGLPLREIPFYKPIFQGMKAEAERRELDLSFFTLNPSRLPHLLTEGGVDGIICLYTYPLGSMARSSQLPCPVLRVGDGEPGDWTLRPDDHQGIYMATRCLIDKGHRKIAYLGDFSGNSTADVMYKYRLEGYLNALTECGIQVRNELIESHIGGPMFELGAAGMQRLLHRSREFSAVVCFNDSSALGAIHELQRQGIRVPEEVSVTGFDGVPEIYGQGPGLTTVHFDRLEMGRRAVEAICDSVEEEPRNETVPQRGHELLPTTLLERGSVASPGTRPGAMI